MKSIRALHIIADEARRHEEAAHDDPVVGTDAYIVVYDIAYSAEEDVKQATRHLRDVVDNWRHHPTTEAYDAMMRTILAIHSADQEATQ